MKHKIILNLNLDQLILLEAEIKEKEELIKNMTKREKKKYIREMVRKHIEANSISEGSV